MPSITIKNIPEDLYQQLKQQANNNRRSLNAETLWVLEKEVANQPRKQITIETIRAARITPKKSLDDDELKEMKERGRK